MFLVSFQLSVCVCVYPFVDLYIFVWWRVMAKQVHACMHVLASTSDNPGPIEEHHKWHPLCYRTWSVLSCTMSWQETVDNLCLWEPSHIISLSKPLCLGQRGATMRKALCKQITPSPLLLPSSCLLIARPSSCGQWPPMNLLFLMPRGLCAKQT